MPSQFAALSDEDKLDLAAHDAALALMRRVEEVELERELERQRKSMGR